MVHIVIEGVIGNAKVYHGLHRAKLRGKEKVQMQFLLTATALNLKKMVKMIDINELKQGLFGLISKTYQFIGNILKTRVNISVFSGAQATSPLSDTLVAI